MRLAKRRTEVLIENEAKSSLDSFSGFSETFPKQHYEN
tara:strand:- start:780 stop:893 length:114 start_codon:yes stop_codon:yes gene_type:complete